MSGNSLTLQNMVDFSNQGKIKNPDTVPDQTVQDVLELSLRSETGIIEIFDQGRFIGAINERSLLRSAEELQRLVSFLRHIEVLEFHVSTPLTDVLKKIQETRCYNIVALLDDKGGKRVFNEKSIISFLLHKLNFSFSPSESTLKPTEKAEEGSTVISGVTEHQEEEVTVVKGDPNGPEEASTKIQGVTEHRDEGVYRVKGEKGSDEKKDGAFADASSLDLGKKTGGPSDGAAQLNKKNEKGVSALMILLLQSKIDSIKLLYDDGVKINERDKEGNTALFYAVKSKNVDALNFLLEKKAFIDLKNSEGVTALYVAAVQGSTDMVKALIEKNASTDIKSKDGRNILMEAAEGGHEDLVEYLLSIGMTNKMAVDNKGRSASILAKRAKHEKIEEMLKKKS